jgi:hypothetical protein
MILSYEDGNTSYAKPNIHKATIWAKSGYTSCAVVFTKACLGSGFSELSAAVCGRMNLTYPHPVTHQCLFLDARLTHDICVDKRTSTLSDVHLEFCNTYTLSHSIPQNVSWDLGGSEDCNETLSGVMMSDKSAREEFQLFTSVLQRSDCDTEYSVTWNCIVCRVSSHCCLSSLPFFFSPREFDTRRFIYIKS